ncbi:MAG: hypothetical protein DHS20C15_10370 [Planctomycetota bacterium]|nr:MAG: hypothetical protein DHS20C15_10370 [Planctomycetota bacterium]
MIFPAVPRCIAWSAAFWLLASSMTWAQDELPPPESTPAVPAAESDDDAPSPEDLAAQALAEALRRLRQADEEALALTVPAVDAVRAEAWDELGELLDSGAPSTRVAVLTALRNTQSDTLLPHALRLAVDPQAAPDVQRAAGDLLDSLAVGSNSVFDGFLQALRDDSLPDEQQARVMRALGGSRRLAAVDALIQELSGPHVDVACRALSQLTGQPERSGLASAAAWTEWWGRNNWQTREQMLEAALAEERAQTHAALRARDDEIVQLHLRYMGQDVSRLLTALSLDHAPVRLEAARRLGRHANPQQAASAVPVLLARLGHSAQPGTTNGNGHAHEGDESDASDNGALETDPEVRRMAVAALGVLGADLPEVRAALLVELRSQDLGTAAEAVGALARVRSAPEVVLPLLDLLERPGLSESVQVTALTVISQNRPLGVTSRLLPWTTPERPPVVRAAGVRALLAGANPSEVLAQVEAVVAGASSADVRYAVAMGLGEQLRRLGRSEGALDSDVRLEIVQVLGRLLDDVDASVRAEAASSLGDSGQLGALGLLENRSRAEADVSVMSRILDALGTLHVIDAVDTIGRVCAGWQGDGRDALESAARRAVQAIGDEKAAADWLGMARTLQQVGAFPLSAWVLREALHRFEGDPAEHEVVSQARGELANVLWQAGLAAEAHALLVELHQAGAPHPIATTRLDLLARTSEQLGYHDQAAEFYAERLGILGEGDSTRDENRRSLLRTLMASGQAEEALPLILELLDEDGADNALLETQARAHSMLGALDEARAIYLRLLERLPVEDSVARDRVTASLAEVDQRASGAAASNGDTEVVSDGESDSP